MHRRLRHLLLAAAAALPMHAARAELLLVTEESPPNNMTVNGVLTGLATDKVAEMMRRAGVAYRMEVLPWARAYLAALNKGDTCIFSTTRTPEREPLFKWIGPLAANHWVLYGLSEREWKLKTLDEARPFSIGTYRADVRDEYLRQRGFRVDAAVDDDINPRKLLLRRIELWATNPAKAEPLLRQHGWQERIRPVLRFNSTQLYLACNAGVDDATVARLVGALAAMEADGTVRSIERFYDADKR